MPFPPTCGPPPEGGPRSGSRGARLNGSLKQIAADVKIQAPLGKTGRLPWSDSPGQPPASPPGQEGGTGPQAQVQHLSQNGYSLSLSLSFFLSAGHSLSFFLLGVGVGVRPSGHWPAQSTHCISERLALGPPSDGRSGRMCPRNPS